MRLPRSSRQWIPLAVALVVADILVMFALHRDEHHLRFRALLIATLVLAFFGSVALMLRFLFRRGRRAGWIGLGLFAAFMSSMGGLAAYSYWEGSRARGPFKGERPTTVDEVRARAYFPVLALPPIPLTDPCTRKPKPLALESVRITEDWSQISFEYSHTLRFQAADVGDDFLIGGDRKMREEAAEYERARRARGEIIPPSKDGAVRKRDARFHVDEIYPPGMKPACGGPSRSVGWVERGVLFELAGHFTWDMLEQLANRMRFVNQSGVSARAGTGSGRECGTP